MARKLLIVESPAKAKTINKYLGSGFKVIASFGHIRDLPKKNGSIEVDNNFKAKYQIIAKNKKHVDEIVASSKECTEIFLATDLDREGEAIAWHISEILKSKKINKPIRRVTFNEITKQTVLDAVNNPREIDINLVEAQQARLSLDYLIGFNISPLLWRKIRPGLSAGRVQSPALRLIFEREIEIRNFVPEDYFSVWLNTTKDAIKFAAKLIKHNDKKIDIKTIKTKTQAEEICNSLINEKEAVVDSIVKKKKNKNPLAPFITSTLQIEASRKLGFNTEKTMKIAQSLYEGVDIGREQLGLITYMRTDSVSLSAIAVDELRQYIEQNYAKEYLPKIAVKYMGKVKNAQEAHEAIRPSSIFRTPQSLSEFLNSDQYKLYELIWQRTLACQVSPAILDTTTIDLKVCQSIFRVNGISINFDGFMKVYKDSDETTQDDNIKLPKLVANEKLPIIKIDFQEHQTEPKPRYSEATLVKALEELGIGRPSTYASIISTLKKREYVILDKKRFLPTDIGNLVSQFLINHLTQYVDFTFTAKLEDTLDDISNGTNNRLPVLTKFWQELEQIIETKQNIARSDLVTEKLDELCPKCNNQLITRLGKYGKFIGCSAYPECKYMRKVENNDAVVEEPEVINDRVCPKDNGVLLIRTGRYGKFISCKNYPKCKYIENINDNTDNSNQVACPGCDNGQIVTKKNRYGNWFYACNNYPSCKTLFNHKPLEEKCPECSYSILLHKITKTKEQKVCPKCDFSEDINK